MQHFVYRQLLVIFFSLSDDDEHDWITRHCRKGWDEIIGFKEQLKAWGLAAYDATPAFDPSQFFFSKMCKLFKKSSEKNILVFLPSFVFWLPELRTKNSILFYC